MAGSAVWRVVEVPALRRILGAYGVSKIGDQLYSTALIVVVLQRTGSASWVSATIIAYLLPYAVVTPFAGVLADRVDRRRLMVSTDLGRAALMLLATLVVVTKAPIPVLLAVAFVSTSVGTPFVSALNASLPELVDEDRLPAANAAVQGLTGAGLLGGPTLAAVVLGLGVQWLPFAANAVTFLFSAALLSGVRAQRRPVGDPPSGDPPSGDPPSDDPPVGASRETFGQALATGFRSVTQDPLLRAILVIAVPALIAYGMQQVLLSLVSRDQLATGEAGLGWLTAAGGLGGVLGIGLATRLARWDRLLLAFGLTAIGTTVPLGVLGVVHTPVIAYALLLVDGVASLCLEVVAVTAIQRVLPLDQVARVDGLFTSVGVVSSVTGNVLAPVLVGAVGLSRTLIGTSAVCATVSVIAFALTGNRRTASRAPDLVVFLRGVRSLDGLSQAGFEALAAAAGPVETLPAGSRLLVAGELADEVLLLVSGSCDVLAAGPAGTVSTTRPTTRPTTVVVNRVAGPDLLGEIGVLRRRPRTATVVATSQCEVRRVPAAAFSAVLAPELSPGEDLPTALSITVNARLGRWSG